MKKNSKLIKQVLISVLVFGLLLGLYVFLRNQEAREPVTPNEPVVTEKLDEKGFYNSKDDVALYIHQYGKLPPNFVTKKQAREKGWSSGTPEKQFGEFYAIGGDVFSNREGILPKKEGRTYYECDIDTAHQKKRGSKRIVFSSDGLIYYTEDHYEHFELLYGEE